MKFSKETARSVKWTSEILKEDLLNFADPLFLLDVHDLLIPELLSWPPVEKIGYESIALIENEVLKAARGHQEVNLEFMFSISDICSLRLVKKSTMTSYFTEIQGFYCHILDYAKYIDRYLDIPKNEKSAHHHYLKHGYFEKRCTDCFTHPAFPNQRNFRSVYEVLLPIDEESKLTSQFFSRHKMELEELDVEPKTLEKASASVLNEKRVISTSHSEENPVVSFVIPCYKQTEFLQSTLYSLAASTQEIHECIIVDDGNSDTRALQNLGRIFACNTKQQITILSTQNRGLAKSRNIGALHARGKYLKFVDSDDLLVSGSVDSQISHMKKMDMEVTLGGYVSFNESEGSLATLQDLLSGIEIRSNSEAAQLTPEFILKFWEEGLTIPIHSMLGHRDSLPAFDEVFETKEDFDFWIRLLETNPRIDVQSEVVAIYRLHEDQMTRANFLKHGFYFTLALQKAALRDNEKKYEETLIDKLKYVERKYGFGSLDQFQRIHGYPLPYSKLTGEINES